MSETKVNRGGKFSSCPRCGGRLPVGRGLKVHIGCTSKAVADPTRVRTMRLNDPHWDKLGRMASNWGLGSRAAVIRYLVDLSPEEGGHDEEA